MTYLAHPHPSHPSQGAKTHALSDEGSGDRTLCGRQLLGSVMWCFDPATDLTDEVSCSQCRTALGLDALDYTRDYSIERPEL